MDIGREEPSQRLEHNTALNKLLTHHQLDMLQSASNMTDTEHDITSNDVSGDLLEMFESQLQQTVHLVDLMPADQKSRALASMCGLLSQKLPESSGKVTAQEKEDYPTSRHTTQLSASGDDMLGTPPSSLVQNDPYDISHVSSSSGTEKQDPGSQISNTHSDQFGGTPSDGSVPTTEEQHAAQNYPNDNKITKEIKRECEENIALPEQNFSNCMSDTNNGTHPANIEEVNDSHCAGNLLPKKWNGGRQIHKDGITALGLGLSETSKNASAETEYSSTNTGSAHFSQESVNQSGLRRSKRERKISVRIAEFLGPKTSLLKSENILEADSITAISGKSNSEKLDAVIVPVKRGRGRPRKNSSIPSVTGCMKTENKERPTTTEDEGQKVDYERNSAFSSVRDVKPILDAGCPASTDVSSEQPQLDNTEQTSESLTSSGDSEAKIDTMNNNQRMSSSDSTLVSNDNKEYENEASLQADLSFHSEHNLGCSETKVCKTTDKTQSNSGVSTGDASITSEPGDSDEGRPAVIKVESNTELISMKNVDKYIMKENNKYRCTICGKLGNYKANLKVHLRVHSGERPYRCEICNKSFAASNNLQRHINETHEKRRPFICESCGQGFFTMKSLSRHQLKKHSPEEEKKKQTFTCETCGKSFKWRSDLKDHSVKHSNTVPYKCETCGRAFTFVNNLRRHLKIHKDYRPHQCRHCGKRFIEPRCLRLHINRIHLGMDIKPHGDPKYRCEICEKPFYMKSWLELHMLSHTGHKPHACEICDKKFSLKANLKRHMLTHTGENPFACTECTKKFKSRRALKLHLMIHRNEKPFVCDICKKGFTNKSALKEHMLIHDSQPRFFCNTCNQTFLRVSHLQLHMERHEGKPRHSCDKCNGKFYRKCDLNRHLLKHSSIKPYGCSWCNKRFTRKQYLTNHIRVNHPTLNRNDQMRKVLLQVMPSQNLSRPIFRIVSKQSAIRDAAINESVDVSSLLKLSECSNSLLTVNASNQEIQDIPLSLTHTMSDSVTLDTVITNTSVVNDDLGAMSKTNIDNHPDPLQQATSMLFESEEECQDAAVMTTNMAGQYVTIQESFNGTSSGLTTLVKVAAEEHQRQADIKPSSLDKKHVVLRLADSEHIVMVTSTEGGSFISQGGLDHLDIMQLKNEAVTSNIQQSAGEESYEQNAAGIELNPSNILETNILSPNLKMPSDASFVELGTSSTEHHSEESHHMPMPDNVNVAGDIMSVQDREHIFMETANDTFTSQLETGSLVLGPYAQVADQNAVQGDAQYHEVIMLNGERMQLLIQSPNAVHNIELPHGSDVQVINESMLRSPDQIIQDDSANDALETTKDSQVLESEVIFQPEATQQTDTNENMNNSLMKDEKMEQLAQLNPVTEGQYLVILKE